MVALSRKRTFAIVVFVALFLFASCSSLSPSESARIMIVHPVNGSSCSGSSTRLLLRCVGACDDLAVIVSFSSGETLQVHTSASVDIEDLPSGWNKISVELLAQDLSQPMLYGSELLRDEVSFFVLLREGDAGPGSQGGEALRLMPPSAPIVIGSTVQLSVLSDSPIEPSLMQHLSARVDGQIFGHSSPQMSAPDEFHVVIEGLVVETGSSTVSVLVAGRDIAGSPLTLLAQQRVVPHTAMLPEYVGDASHHDKCWATIITSPSFVLGAVALGHSLNPVNSSSAAIKVALVTAQLPFADRCVLTAAGWLLRNVSIISNPNVGHISHFSNVYSKLHVFDLERTCRRVVYIDADVVAVDALAAGELFNIDMHGNALAASPEINPPAWFNSGVLVFDPNKRLRDEIFEQAQRLESYDKTDQGMLNELFVQRWKMLSYTFNFLKDTGALADRFHWFTKERWHTIKLVHLTGKKPWQCLADHLCNVAGRQSAIIWDFWWAKMREACDQLPRLSCDFH